MCVYVCVCVVVECPSLEYLQSLVTNSQLLKYMSPDRSEDDNEPCLVVHCTPAAVMANDAYQSWMLRSVVLSRLCNSDITEVVSNDTYITLCLRERRH